MPSSCGVACSRTSRAASHCPVATLGLERSKQASSAMRSGLASSTWQMSTRMWRLSVLYMCRDVSRCYHGPTRRGVAEGGAGHLVP